MRGDWEALLNAMRLEIDRRMALHKRETPAIVDSYDPEKHVAKVKLQPGGRLTGWLPISGGVGTGDRRGFAYGLKAKDHVIVQFQGASLQTGVIMRRLWNEEDKPIKNVKSGDYAWVGDSQQWIKMNAEDKSLMLRGYPGSDDPDSEDRSSVSQLFDKNGNLIYEAKKGFYKWSADKGYYEWNHPKGDATFKPGSGQKVQVQGRGQVLRVMLEDGSPSEVLLATKK